MRDINGRFIDQHELKYLRTNKGRKKVGVCNCCKTNTIPKNRFYCDNCRDWIESVRTKQQTKLQGMKFKVKRYQDIFGGSDPGNIMQMLESFKSYKSSSDHYRRKCEIILAAYNELVAELQIETKVFKLQNNSVVLNVPETIKDNFSVLEKPLECILPGY